jgi:signal transduction histidine kinase
MSFSSNRLPKKLLMLTIVPLLLVGATLVVLTALQLRDERQVRRENALDDIAAQIAGQVKSWGESTRVAALSFDGDDADAARGARLLDALLARFPDVASVQLFDENGRRVLARRRVGVLSLPDIALDAPALRAHVQRLSPWIAPLHFQPEGSPRLPFVTEINDHRRARGFLAIEFQTTAIDILLKRAAFPMTLAHHSTPDRRRASREIENLGLILSLRDPVNAWPGVLMGLAGMAVLLTVVFIIAVFERRWSRRAADDIAHRERLMTIGATASAIGHELRTALAVIRNAVDALKLRVDLSDPRAAKQADAIECQVRLGNRLLSDLLEFARPRNAVLKPENIHPLIEDVVSTLTLPRSIRVETSLSPSLPLIALDMDKMRQVLANLILNAADAMPEGGSLVIATRLSGNRALIEIRDRGAGMTPDVHARLFEPFFSTKARGMGLGLSIVKKIVDAHAGDIHVESAPGAGTTVSVFLPISDVKSDVVAFGAPAAIS